MRITDITNPLFVICCVLTAAVCPIGVIVALVRHKKQAMLALAAKPWEQRDDWSCGRAKSSVQTKPAVLWIIAAFMTLFFLAMLPLPDDGDGSVWCIFPVVVFLLICAVCMQIRRQRYGATCFQFDSLPFSPGTDLSGYIQLRHDAPLPHGLKVRLECLKIVGEDEPTRTTLWSKEQIVTPKMIVGSPNDRRLIPVSFPIPNDALETNKQTRRQWIVATSERITWQLLVNPRPGMQMSLKHFFDLSYSDAFEVPVFRIPKNVLPMHPKEESPAQAARTETGSVLARW